MVAESKVIRLTPFHLSDTVISSWGVSRCIPGTTILQVFHQAHFKRQALSTLDGQSPSSPKDKAR
jgi:hypothetical protein